MSPAPPLSPAPAAERRMSPGRRLKQERPLPRGSAKDDAAEYPRKDDATLGTRAWTGHLALPSKIPTTKPALPGFRGLLLLRGMVVALTWLLEPPRWVGALPPSLSFPKSRPFSKLSSTLQIQDASRMCDAT